MHIERRTYTNEAKMKLHVSYQSKAQEIENVLKEERQRLKREGSNGASMVQSCKRDVALSVGVVPSGAKNDEVPIPDYERAARNNDDDVRNFILTASHNKVASLASSLHVPPQEFKDIISRHRRSSSSIRNVDQKSCIPRPSPNACPALRMVKMELSSSDSGEKLDGGGESDNSISSWTGNVKNKRTSYKGNQKIHRSQVHSKQNTVVSTRVPFLYLDHNDDDDVNKELNTTGSMHCNF
jgi:hypothetical protein